MPSTAPPQILIFAPAVSGGLAEYVYYQAEAIGQTGVNLTCLVSLGFLDGRKTHFQKIVCLPDSTPVNFSRFWNKFKMFRSMLTAQWILAWRVWRQRPDLVLLDSYVEYLSPIWIWPHWLLAKFYHIRYAANLHDPVRSYQIGPAWWHRLSVNLAYRPLDFVLVHTQLPEPSPVPAGVKVVLVPHGLFEIRGIPPDREKVRKVWNIQPGQKVFLAFGFVRDGKNLDLAIRALEKVPEAILVVAGAVASSKDKPFTFYRDLAENLGVTTQCRFYEGFVADEELGNYFAGCDFVLLSYASSFHSQSGVLNVAARARKPVLASASPSPLVESVTKFKLGEVVAPDSLAAVIDGMRTLIQKSPAPLWEAYESASAWSANAHEVLAAAGLTCQ